MGIPEFDITGQKVLIVGGGRGIGKGIALAFAEVGYLCVFLAAPAAAYVTGQTWAVDGGVSIRTV